MWVKVTILHHGSKPFITIIAKILHFSGRISSDLCGIAKTRRVNEPWTSHPSVDERRTKNRTTDFGWAPLTHIHDLLGLVLPSFKLCFDLLETINGVSHVFQGMHRGGDQTK